MNDCMKGKKMEEEDDMSPNTRHIDHLSDYDLMKIMSHLSIKQLFVCESVCRRWHQLIPSLLLRQKTLRIGPFMDVMHCNDKKHDARHDDISPAFDYVQLKFQVTRKRLDPIISKCANIKSLYLNNCCLSAETFVWLLSQCPHLQCITIISITGFNDTDWHLIVSHLNPEKLVHVSFYDYSNALSISPLIEKLVNLEELNISSYQPLNEIFTHLNGSIRRLALIHSCLDYSSIEALIEGNGRGITEVTIIDSLCDNWGIELIANNLMLRKFCIEEYFYNFDYKQLASMKELMDLRLAMQQININSMSVMPNVVSLQLKGECKPSKFVSIGDVFPACRELKIWCHFECECVPYINDCQVCYQTCIDSLSKLSSLQRLEVSGTINDHLLRALLKFPSLTFIKLYNTSSNYYNTELLMQTCLDLVDRSDQHSITVVLEKNVIHKIEDMGIGAIRGLSLKELPKHYWHN